MGGCQSTGAGSNIIEKSDGGEEEYHKRFLEDALLGAGEFGEVKMVHDMLNKSRGAEPLACKALKKGVVFKDNTLYTPMKPEILRGEIEMLRKLDGRQFCLKLIAIYETPKVIYMITEYCGGGEMMEYVGSLKEDLTTEDVSRIAFQLLSALNHCAKNQVLHRDIKPENIMFQDPSQGSPLRLIDFGSGTLDSPDRKEDDKHTTFAGTAFYTSPELFQRAYDQLTDVWSAGVVLYVLVAGYPADVLQKAFNLLQSSKRDLKTLPGMPDNMPDSYYELLAAALTYKPKLRKTAAELLQFEFTKFHKQQDAEQTLSLEQVAAAAASAEFPSGEASRIRRQGSVSLRGSVSRHNMFLGFKRFERSLTALLAALLSKKELDTLVTKLKNRVAQQNSSEPEGPSLLFEQSNKQLAVISMEELKQLIREVADGNQM
jgi:calcium-dependent protein kinase